MKTRLKGPLAVVLSLTVFGHAAVAQKIGQQNSPQPQQAQAQPAQGQPAQQQDELGPVVGDGKIRVAPQMRVGQKTTASFSDFPDPGEGDQLVVVSAGAPDNITSNSSGEKPLAYTYAGSRWIIDNGWEIGPFAPGRYEVRWLTQLYNNEKKLEVGARAQFSVRR
ncbi:hypothetical protein GJW-30_1_02540 [Variibacter gotjawalensis]|uniref:Uncharacterized protein n=1 Tax=Variibacter gotjawalensis TaxID=1333996 RepID=A0A0S3PVP5_9BRAD|nr:hypothetical protein [Variibacter gotjawalensis]NIK45827.1 hypothetical protein [Variibacter gotjawalensis]RZS47751.1 hypothetical protein EV661_0144 [Variibacter gotjawalensis]BAT60005.1 hypothetical protein GJW-30_1_02540 [Variibacter gotjawalensis]